MCRIVAAHREFGTTSCLPTLITDFTDVIERLAAAAADCIQIPGVLGFHLEGPALSKAREGVHLECHIGALTRRDLLAMQSIGRHGRSIVTIAPECVASSIIDELIQMGFRVSAGHTDASAAEVRAAADRGMSGITHLFNAMSQLTSREPGVVGAALDDDRLFAGVNCDGIHVDPVSLRIAARCKGANRLMLITDAMPLIGTDHRQFELQGRRITLQDDRLTAPDGTLAGAHLTMIQAVRNAVALVGLTLTGALTMASRTPATFLGMNLSGTYRTWVSR
ncbi:N-acetylglucosamine-6-phosphate deacetylase [Bradyrhizobium shewense]|uniref:N-acetylglucosamine-6-phosphate deacetylase n=1 Tax=Bradyrhizobium shewense TaxID=1761772 RepID=A0A1C3WS65_9BRAD|nr:N-acetylglucosamine-6-phosphate deacetylase [Bradyrhizobium shewense]